MTGGLFMGYKTTKPTSIIHITGEAGEKLMEALQKNAVLLILKKQLNKLEKNFEKKVFTAKQ